jgi:murein DD-endopeptidase MepM/ murein hydrolase activator NlpD
MPDTLFTLPVGPDGWLSNVVLRVYGAHLRQDPNTWRTAWEQLARYNNVRDADLVFAGQVLALPPSLVELARRVSVGDVHLVEPPDPAAIPDDPGRIAAANAPTPSAPIVLPVPPGVMVVSGYGRREAFGSFPAHFHGGVDLAGPGYATWVQELGVRGTVLRAGDVGDGYGNAVVVGLRGAPYRLLFAHLADVRVGVGQAVGPGVPLGEIGASGMSAGEHLHLGVLSMATAVIPIREWAYGQEIDPAPLLQVLAAGGARRAA